MPAPTVTSISPASGSTLSGTNVTITGSNFTGTTGVTLGGTAATGFTVVSDTSITCTAPAHGAGTASVLVTNATGTNAANSLYTYVAAPTVSGISPSSGPLSGGTSVTITGTHFTGATGVTLGGTAVTGFTVVSDTSITTTAPAHIAGSASVVVTTPGGTNAVNSLYTYVATPTVSGISPSIGAHSGGGSVTITGTNFTGAPSVTIGGAPATGITVVSSSSITCTLPSGSAGTASVLVTTAGGTNAANSLYTYVVAPTVTSISPPSGPLSAGTIVTITGVNFTGTTGVTFGGTAVTGFTVVSDTSITTTAPAHSAGSASVVVTNADGSNAANSLYTYLAVPAVTSLSPASGSSAGGTSVTITGTNFTGATGVTIRSMAATSVAVISSTSLTCVTPAGTVGTASVVVTTPGGANAANSLFGYVPPPPTVGGISPSTGSTLGGNSVTISGTSFTGAGSVTIGGVPVTNVTVVSDTSLTCITPAGSVGTASVLVTTPSGSNADNSLFAYALKAPTVASLLPASGTSAGGTSVTLTGTYLTGTSGVTIGGVAATHVVVINDSTLTCITPMGTAGTPTSVVVTTPSGHNADNSLFTYVLALPTVASVSPPIGVSAGGTRITITGTYFTGAMSVTFGGMAVPSFTVVNETTISCTTPAGFAGTASVLVTAAAGTSAANSLYLYVQAEPEDTYIYLKGGRGDGFVPQWTGSYTDALVDEKSEPYRNIFQTSAQTTVTGVNGVSSSGSITLPGVMQSVRNFFPASWNVDSNLSYTAGAMSDEAAGATPRQFVRTVTWRAYTSSNGMQYHFRLADILGIGSQPRGA